MRAKNCTIWMYSALPLTILKFPNKSLTLAHLFLKKCSCFPKLLLFRSVILTQYMKYKFNTIFRKLNTTLFFYPQVISFLFHGLLYMLGRVSFYWLSVSLFCMTRVLVFTLFWYSFHGARLSTYLH